MLKKSHLKDLYRRGKELRLDDGDGEATVWLQKLSPVDHATAVSRASAARARALMSRNDPDSDDYMSAYGAVIGSGVERETLIRYINLPELGNKEMIIEAEMAAEEEWSKDDYLQGLRDAWNDTLELRYALEPDDPECKRVFAELTRFADAVNARMGVFEADMARAPKRPRRS
jgi:hypothetical protein